MSRGDDRNSVSDNFLVAIFVAKEIRLDYPQEAKRTCLVFGQKYFHFSEQFPFHKKLKKKFPIYSSKIQPSTLRMNNNFSLSNEAGDTPLIFSRAQGFYPHSFSRSPFPRTHAAVEKIYQIRIFAYVELFCL